MTCSFTLSNDGKVHELAAERVAVSDTIETWRVCSRLDPNFFIALSNDKPLLQNKRLYTDQFKWTIIEGEAVYKRMTTQITTYLEYYIKGLWKPPTKGINEQKAAAAKQQGRLF